jgi:hypothetical protein
MRIIAHVIDSRLDIKHYSNCLMAEKESRAAL